MAGTQTTQTKQANNNQQQQKKELVDLECDDEFEEFNEEGLFCFLTYALKRDLVFFSVHRFVLRSVVSFRFVLFCFFLFRFMEEIERELIRYRH